MIQLNQQELAELRALIKAQQTPAPEVEQQAPAPRPLVTQSEFLAACVIASLVLFFLLGK